jgi:ribonuclease PH
MAIRNTMEQTILTHLLPRTQIDIYVQVGPYQIALGATLRARHHCAVF